MNIKTIVLSIVATSLLALTGCTSINISPSVVQQGVATGVKYSVSKYPTSRPYLTAATPVICSVANSTNLVPSEVITAIENSDANKLKTPEGVLILNSALTLYISIWNSYGSNAVNNATALQPYLKATCNGLNDGLHTVTFASPSTLKNKVVWPLVKF